MQREVGRAGSLALPPAPRALTALDARHVRDGWTGWRAASDPGLLRLRLAVRATLAVGLIALVASLVGPAVGVPGVVAVLLGGMVGMNGSFAASSRTPLDAGRTLLAFPFVAAAGALPAALLAPVHVLQLAGFVLLMVGAVFVRRYGPRAQVYGMLAWFAYFFTVFLALPVSRLPGVLAVVVVATACLLLVAVVLVPDRPEAVLAAAQRAFDDRVRALAQTAAGVVLGQVPGDRVAGRLHERGFRLVEAALLVDGLLAPAEAGGGPAPAAVRRALVDAELAAEDLAAAVADLHPDAHAEPAAGRDAPADPPADSGTHATAGTPTAGTPTAALPSAVRQALVEVLDALARDDTTAARVQARRVRDLVEAATPDLLDPHTAAHVRVAVGAAGRLAQALQRAPGASARVPAHVSTHEPAVELALGNLPGSVPSVLDAVQASGSRLTLNGRLCVQTAVAASVTVVLGDLLSRQRYAWALLACLLVLTGTFTTGEVTTKGASRVAGTVAGLGAASVAVHLTGSDTVAVVAVMLACVFVGLYFFRVSYAVMTFAVTTLLGELYNVLHELTPALLALRLGETALGAGVAVLVGLLVLPVRTADARAAAHTAFLAALDDLLATVAERLDRPERAGDLLLLARRLDARLHQYALVARPGAGATLAGLGSRRAVELVAAYTEVAHRARVLAAVVAGVEPGSRPGLAGRVRALREAEPAADGPQDPVESAVEALARAVRLLPEADRRTPQPVGG